MLWRRMMALTVLVKKIVLKNVRLVKKPLRKFFYPWKSSGIVEITMGAKSPISIFLFALLISGLWLACVTHFSLAQDSTKFKISGYITDSSGRGIANANIIFNVPQTVPSVYSSSSGYYEIFAPQGTYHVNVWPPFDANYISYDEPGFTVGSDISKNITLYSGYKISGYISDAAGNPVVGACVFLENASNWYGSGWFSNSAGYYFLSAPAGTYTIDAHPRTGNYYSGPTTDFPTYYEYNFTVDSNTVKNITVGSFSPAPSPVINPNINASESWPMFHKDVTHSGYSESAGPLTNQVLWKYQVGSAIESSPTVAYGVVYFGSLWNGHNGFVNALNATTGSKIWQFATDSGMESSPAVVDGVVYIGSWGGHVYALDAANGAEIWSFNAGGPVFPSPAIVDGVVYVGSASGYMYALNAANGSPLWSHHTNGTILSSPAVVEGVVYFGSEDQTFYALRASDGAQIWHYSTGGYIDGSPVVAGGLVYFGSRDGYVYALNATDGSKTWSFRPSHGNYGSYYYSTPAVANGVVYVGGYDSYIYALNAANGNMFWEFRTGSYIFSSPIVAGNVVYVGSYDGNVYALDAITGGKIWNYQTGNKIRSSPAVANGVAYIGSDDGYLYAFGSPSGQPTSYKISGYILDANGNGIAGANIIFNVPSIVASVWSDPSGYYAISAPPGTYHVNVWPPFDSNYINYDEPGFVVGSDIAKNITLYSGCKVSGYISDSSGNPVVGAAVLLRNSAGTFGSGWFSNSSGYYFLSVPAGTYTIDAHPRFGNYYSGTTTDFPTYYEYNFTVKVDTVKNITVGGTSPKASLNSEPASTAKPLPEKVTELMPEPSTTTPPPDNNTPGQITISTKAPPMTLLGLLFGIVIVGTPFVTMSVAFVLFYLKRRKN
jgi:outer membrane protein assembly factor BamB